MVGLKNGHICKNLTENSELQRSSWGTQKKKKKYSVLNKGALHKSSRMFAMTQCIADAADPFLPSSRGPKKVWAGVSELHAVVELGSSPFCFVLFFCLNLNLGVPGVCCCSFDVVCDVDVDMLITFYVLFLVPVHFV